MDILATLFLLNIFMISSPAKTVLNMFVVIAFLSMQFSSAHIHLAENHQHDGNQHQHVSQGHAHALSDHHEDAFENTQASPNNHVVEIPQELTLQNGNKDFSSTLMVSSFYQFFPPSPKVTLAPYSNPLNSQTSWFKYSNVRLRAPPAFTS
ncbi:MAG: hypothetical protein V7785_04620 [Bermanella sp.]